jgi:two-component system chemotaxis response regulator CheB
MIRVLVAEDSDTTRTLLVALLNGDPDIEVVGQAPNGAVAIEMTRELRPDVVTMDVKMPVLDGYAATRKIMVETPTPIVIVSANVQPRDIETAMHALRAGALAIVRTPAGPSSTRFEEEVAFFLETVKAMSSVKVVRRWPDRESNGDLHRAHSRHALEIVGIAASTGGPAAILSVLTALPADFPVPILAVQHMAREFVIGCAEWLDTHSPLQVKVASHHERVEPGTVYFAPDDHHLGVIDGHITLDPGPPIDGFRPSGTFLFQSLAAAYGAGVAAVILTGMGRDGVDGLHDVRRAGGEVIAQDEASSVVFGMPHAAILDGVTSTVLPLAAIPQRLIHLAALRERKRS